MFQVFGKIYTPAYYFSWNLHICENFSNSFLISQILISSYLSDKVEELLESSNGGGVTVHRVGDHVDLADGPLISTTAQLGRFSVTAVSLFFLTILHSYLVTLIS